MEKEIINIKNEKSVISSGKINIELIRHGKPEYVDKMMGKTLDEIMNMLAEGKFEELGLDPKEGYEGAIKKGLREKNIHSNLLIISSTSERTKLTGRLVAAGMTAEEKIEAQKISAVSDKAFDELLPDFISGRKYYDDAYDELKNENKFNDPDKITRPEEIKLLARKALDKWFKDNRANVEERVSRAIDKLKELAEKHKGSKILLISHGILLTAMRAKIEGKDVESIFGEKPINPCEGYGAVIDTKNSD